MIRPALLLLATASLGCGPSLTAETDWVRWFSEQTIEEAAISPQGELVVVGHSSGSQQLLGTTQDLGLQTSRSILTTVDHDGERGDTITDFVGQAAHVAIDDDGNRYVLVRALRDRPDWSTRPGCELRAHDPQGGIRWTKRWENDTSAACPLDVAVVGSTVVVTVLGHVEALDPEGRTRWASPAGGVSIQHPLRTSSDAVWLVHSTVTAWESGTMLARRFEIHDGTPSDIELDLPGWRIGPYAIADTGIVMVALRSDPSNPLGPSELRLAAFTFEGSVRWTQPLGTVDLLADSTETWYPLHTDLAIAGDEVWLATTELRYDSLEESISHRRMVVRRFDRDGQPQGSLHRQFASTPVGPEHDRPPPLLAAAECGDYDEVHFGSTIEQILVDPDGRLLLVGHQECRDSFVLALEVQR